MPSFITGLWVALSLALAQAGTGPCRAAEPPPWLPHYDLSIQLDVANGKALVRQRVTWHNRHHRATNELIFNAHSHYAIPAKDMFLGAKTVELLRMSPSETLDLDGPCLNIDHVLLGGVDLPFHYLPEDPTALRVELPLQIAEGDSVAVELCFSFRLPHKQGRWGQWRGISYLSNWLPMLSVYDELGWHPVPYIPWHQPFFNEAGLFSAKLCISQEQKVACSLPIAAERPVPGGMKEVEFIPQCLRDFALLASADYIEATACSGDVEIRCLALPEHRFYAEKIVQWICEALPVYTRWVGPYPYKHFTVVESFFGWAGNECAGLVMIDNRVFDMPHIAACYVEYLVSHEFLHQWFYNTIGTNGYAETWMDEGWVVYLSHRLMDKKHGHNNYLLEYPYGLGWLPNIHRETFRSYSYIGAMARGDNGPTIRDMPEFGFLSSLLSTCYDRGSRIVGMIEERMGEAAFFEFIHVLYAKYYFRILRVADLRCELEAFTGRSWEQFFNEWLYGGGVTDWCVEKVKLQPLPDPLARERFAPACMTGLLDRLTGTTRPWHAIIILHQKAQINEPTVLGICLDGSENYQIRLPIDPAMPTLEVENPPAHVVMLPGNRVQVDVDLPSQPTQITVDPDQVLMDGNAANNSWKPRCSFRLTPLYTPLDETDVTNDYDRWNFIAGPGFTGTAYNDPWYSRSDVFGARAGFYRTQEAYGAVYTGYRTDTRDIVVGVDSLIDHWPFPRTQVGFNGEHGLTPMDGGDLLNSRAVAFMRYIFMYGNSMYLPPSNYVEGYTAYLNNPLPNPRYFIPGADPFDQQTVVGAHYHLDTMVPYWDPENGYRFDVAFGVGVPILGEERPFERVDAQVSAVHNLPDWTGPLADTKVAARLYGGAASPSDGELLTLGGSLLYRGFDQAQRQGNLVWVASLEWRIPVVRGVSWDYCDHVASVKNIYLAPFYDAGNAYIGGHSIGPVANALGLGFRVDVAWFSLIERTMLRMDVAQTLDRSSPTQVWFGIQQPF